MGQKEFDLILCNIDEITNAVERFPSEIQDRVYSSLVASLLSDRASFNVLSINEDSQQIEDLISQYAEDRNLAEELELYYLQFSLDSASDMELAAFLAYFFAKLAPPNEMTDRIDESHYKMACMITGRDLPKRVSGTMNNAKNVKGYLESHGHGVYSISALGEHYVKHRLLKEDD